MAKHPLNLNTMITHPLHFFFKSFKERKLFTEDTSEPCAYPHMHEHPAEPSAVDRQRHIPVGIRVRGINAMCNNITANDVQR